MAPENEYPLSPEEKGLYTETSKETQDLAHTLVDDKNYLYEIIDVLQDHFQLSPEDLLAVQKINDSVEKDQSLSKLEIAFEAHHLFTVPKDKLLAWKALLDAKLKAIQEIKSRYPDKQ